MIPYDDLVIALATWRARQGLPVAQLSGSFAPPPPVVETQPPPVAVPRSNPPAPPRGASPPPLAPPDTRDEMIEDGLIEEAQYDNEGNDFAMAFGNAAPEVDSESTSIGSAPGIGRDSFSGGATDPDKSGGHYE